MNSKNNSLPLIVYDSSPAADSPPPSIFSHTEYSLGTIINKNMYMCAQKTSTRMFREALFTMFNSNAHQQQNG